ncbi:Endonuclease/exonuclease/phosphatase OS=Tsukamurella paurometabola (strain ATCC 8368 / DSM /CCUG 35730 / CIP 100753 / JCM 10117 / KCTC 9821 / NBRC 16120/ NCIMB 702349 / NCTC 13040) OX=521096 GN=Tpau_1302 PE=4 SV=1 [Tsukamurella paurometabola]|uniref:Endonuclease/exonuclease/phosphatase n=1 Tax=Tsukamurella paurometabola (strain ATCC 8368 / DSM 20162 / CCUG 35730 / CIP 100753 / JCM 10117 / KCTC 9821 / NBRC 16120 / NCIMB 702349 / NCTC 13040) TaxID=521096 RepID=D5UWQ9_TSUPD|nr:endonuclease/exonuclease/phosphatase family protein [Tsukamurella paurometabola]ADG77931.1 Endonuclease/exonuclease/phosphatase [Tsukamurella paurometabola DSM 20162]SUP29408.1 Uncharacterized protein conserved in bacteria [Tsukamurella paurometabola]
MPRAIPSPPARSVRRLALGALTAAFIALFTIATATAGTLNVRVLQMNTWNNGQSVKGGEKLLLEEIQRVQPDIVILSEAGTVTQSLATSLNQNGTTYYSTLKTRDSGILSKYPIESSADLADGRATKAIINVDGTSFAVYSLHLNPSVYAPYLPRGYNGDSSEYRGWDQITTGPVTDTDTVLAVNAESGRPAAVARVIADAAAEAAKGRQILLGGDFNEPSNLDWTAATKNTFDHNGAVIPWQSTQQLQDAGYLDAYRTKYPDPVTHPGITWAVGNPLASIGDLDWTPKADGRDRLDFLFTKSGQKLTLKDIGLLGPNTSVANGTIVPDGTADNFLDPTRPFASDHRHLLADYTLTTDKQVITPQPPADTTGLEARRAVAEALAAAATIPVRIALTLVEAAQQLYATVRDFVTAVPAALFGGDRSTAPTLSAPTVGDSGRSTSEAPDAGTVRSVADTRTPGPASATPDDTDGPTPTATSATTTTPSPAASTTPTASTASSPTTKTTPAVAPAPAAESTATPTPADSTASPEKSGTTDSGSTRATSAESGTATADDPKAPSTDA